MIGRVGNSEPNSYSQRSSRESTRTSFVFITREETISWHYRDERVRHSASLCVSGHAYSGSCRVERFFFSTSVLLRDVLDHAVNLDDGDAAVVGVGVVLVFVGGGKRGGDVAANGHRDSFGRRGLRGADGKDAVYDLGGDGGLVHVLGQRDGEGVTPAAEAGGSVGARGERVLAIDLDGEIRGGNPRDRALDQGDLVAVDFVRVVCVFVRVGGPRGVADTGTFTPVA